jgi:transposase
MEGVAMAMGRRRPTVQGKFWIATDTLRQTPGHPFYQRLNTLLDEADFDRFCEAQCRKFYAAKLGRPSVAHAAADRRGDASGGV